MRVKDFVKNVSCMLCVEVEIYTIVTVLMKNITY